MRNCLLPLFLCILYFTSCRSTRPAARDQLFYGIDRTGDRLTVNKQRWVRISSQGVVIDNISGSGSPLVYRIDRIHYNDYPQIFIHRSKTTDYNDFLSGNYKWSVPAQKYLLCYDFWKHKDLPLWHFMDRYEFVIDSADVPASPYGYYIFPALDEGKNDPRYIDVYESFVAEGRKKKEVVFTLADTVGRKGMTAEQARDRTGFDENSTHSENDRFLLLPISSRRREYDMLLKFTESDYGPYLRIMTLKDGEVQGARVVDIDYDLWFEATDGKWYRERRREEVEVYEDYGIRVTAVEEDTQDSLWRWTMRGWYVNENGWFREVADGEELRRMNVEIAPEHPAVDAVTDFLRWYKENRPELDRIPVLRTEGAYRVDMEGAEEYLRRMESSGYLSDSLIGRWRDEFRHYEEFYRENTVDDGPPEGFDCDRVLLTHEEEAALATIPDDVIVTEVELTGRRRAKVTVDLWNHSLTYTLYKDGESWKIAEFR